MLNSYTGNMKREEKPAPSPGPRERLHEIILEADTPAGKTFDVVLLCVILCSVLVVMLDSVVWMNTEFGEWLGWWEWLFTITFTIEYLLRLYCVRRPLRYALSFFGLVDLIAIIPTYLSLLVAGTQSLVVIRTLRLLRVFRVLKLAKYLGEAHVLMAALRASRPKITVFLVTVLSIVVIIGATMYLVEGEEHGFTSIPTSMYWAVVTMTTVGYGDITPTTTLGRTLSAMLMVLGYGIIAVPTGVVSAELVRAPRTVSTQACLSCSAEGHDHDATHCKFCGHRL